MRELARPTPRPVSPAKPTKVLLVRQPIRSVRRSDEPDRLALRLAIGVIAAAGAVVAIWLLGYLGFKLGFADRILGLRELRGELDDGLISGTMMLIAIPRLIILAGVAEPIWLMLGFAMIAVPGAAISATKLPTPGGPRPPQLTVTFSNLGAIAAILNACALLAWAATPWRNQLLRELPKRPQDAESWLTGLQTLAGLDVLAVVLAGLWVVLAMRLAVPLWLRVLATASCIFALVVVAVAMAVSTASVTHVESGRSLAFLDDGSLQPQLILGSTREHVAVLTVDHNTSMIQLLAQPDQVVVVGRQSIIQMLIERARPSEP